MLNVISGIFSEGVPPIPPSTNSYESIQTYTVGSGGSSSITFSSIPSTYKHLQIRAITKTDGAGNGYSMIASANGNTTTADYHSHFMLGDGSSASAAAYQVTGGVYLIGTTTGAGSASQLFSPMVIDILDYASTNKNKTFRYLAGQDRNGAGSITFGSGLWINTSAINSLNLSVNGGNLVQYSSIALYGIKG